MSDAASLLLPRGLVSVAGAAELVYQQGTENLCMANW